MTEGTRGLFLLGFAIGAGVTLTLATLDAPASLTDRLRAERAPASVSISLEDLAAAAPVSRSNEPTTAALPGVEEADDLAPPPVEEIIDPERTTAFLEARFTDAAFDLDQIRAGTQDVPRLTAAAIPLDLGDLVDIPRRKTVFIQMVLPLVLLTNEQILVDRARLSTLQKKETLTVEEQDWLGQLANAYKAEPDDFETLLQRVDVIPPSLAIAQAAVESGWGTSRFAIEGNALFGQWIWGHDADGIVPEDRIEGKDHKIRAFETPLAAVSAYARNLNRHAAYSDLRAARTQARSAGTLPSGSAMAVGLEAYSEKGAEYISLIQGIIQTNDLAPLDAAKLGGAPA